MADLVRRKKAWPRGGGGKFQFCTPALKVLPAEAYMNKVDADKTSTCMIGIRREESRNRRDHPEHIEESPAHGGRDLWSPLVRHTEAMRDELLAKTPFPPLPYRSKECYPCVNATPKEIAQLDELTIVKIETLENEMGVNSKGNPRVMFSPAKHNGAVGIRAVVDNAQKMNDQLFSTVICSSGWCND